MSTTEPPPVPDEEVDAAEQGEPDDDVREYLAEDPDDDEPED